MNPVKDDAAYCYGNLRDGLTFISEKLKKSIDIIALQELEHKLKHDSNLSFLIKVNDVDFLHFPLPEGSYFLLLDTYNCRSTKEIIHDLNNVFNNINNALSILSKRNTENYERRIIDGINDNLQRGQYLLRKLSYREDEEINLVDAVDLTKILSLISDEIANSCPSDITIIKDFENSLNYVLSNEEELYRAFYNICINAKESISNKGEIEISTLNQGNNVIVTIKDNGIGISETDISKIFDLGFSTKNKPTESGIGLSIVKNIIEKYKGTVEVFSQLNIGTTFIVSFPAIIKENKQNEKSNKILIADDDEFMLDLLSELFSSYDYQISTVKSGEELLELAKDNNSFSLLIVDQNMPGLKGLEAIKILRDQGNYSQIILCSGTILDNNKEVLRKLNIADLVMKPYDFDYLLNKVKSLL